MNIIYLHGFNSDGNGSTAKKLKEVYGNLLISPSYDYTNPDKAFKQINKILIENAEINTILVGSSLGGFWANHFAQKYGLPVILINPALDPLSTTKKYIGENKNYSTGKIHNFTKEANEAFKKYVVKINPEIERTTILSINDEVINYKFSEKILKESNIIYEKTQGHRLDNIDKVVFSIDKHLENYVTNLSNPILKEHVLNLLQNDVKEKAKYADEVYQMLQTSYSKVGGLHTNGFQTTDDMINIPMWKLVKKNNKIIAGVFYKDKAGRKRVAGGTDGSIEGKKAFLQITTDEMNTGRSYGEISGPVLAFQKNNIDTIVKNAIPYEKVEAILNKQIKKPPTNDPEILKFPQLANYFYQRLIGSDWHTKLLLGKPGNTFY